MKENEAILKRQKYNLRFKNGDMDFMFSWAIGISQIVGMSASQVFNAVQGLKDGDPAGWRDGFRKQGHCQIERAQEYMHDQHDLAAGQFYLGAAYAFRAALQFADPTEKDFMERVGEMEAAFQRGTGLIGIPIRPVEIPFEQTTLTGYYLEQDAQPRPLVVMIGGGDSYREDLFYVAGYPGWKRGYNVLMVDLPGQGKMPARGLTFRVQMDQPISAALDWLESNTTAKLDQVAIYGISGGGYFTAQAVATDTRFTAWIAGTPIYDMPIIFQREFGSALKAPGWLLNSFMRLSGALNRSAEINLQKYAWQFGTADFKGAVDGVFEQARLVDFTRINLPSLFLVSEGEVPELKRQAHEIYADFCKRGVNVTLREFSADEGADGHCELNNLRLLHLVVFDWLDRLFGREPVDVRLRC